MQYTVTAPKTPGSQPSVVGTARRIADARKLAKPYQSRRDLTHQDVRIERDGKLAEYAGPVR